MPEKTPFGGSGASPRAVRSSSGWENRCPCTFAGVTWASRTETVAAEGVYLGKIGFRFTMNPLAQRAGCGSASVALPISSFFILRRRRICVVECYSVLRI